MPRKYPAEVRRQVIELARSGTKIAQLAETFGMSDATIYTWLKQEKIDRGEIPGLSTEEALDLAAAKRRIKQLETELAVSRKVNEVFLEGDLPPKRLFPVIDSLIGQGINTRHACRVLGVSESGCYAWKGRPDPPRTLRRIWPAGEIADVHKASGGTYGEMRVTAELRHGREILVSHNTVGQIMREIGLKGLPTRRLPKGARMAQVTSLDLVRREFRRKGPNQLWMTDITEHPTREGKVYCCVVLDAFSRLVVGWAVESTQTTVLVTNALGMATARRDQADGLVIHSDRGVQFTSWAFSRRVKDAGIAPSMGAVGSAYDNATVESFWGRMQVELFNRKRWITRVELATAIHDYIELFHNTRRRHSALGMLSPTEYEDLHNATREAA